MAFVAIVTMFGFIGGGTLLRHFSRRATGMHKTMAYFGDNRKITSNDLYVQAQRELDVFRSLAADVLLRNQDLRGILLGELLFAEQQTSPALISHIRRTIRTNRYRISDKQINDMYKRPVPSSIYWLLLKNEAQLAGIRVPIEQAGEVLGQVIPQLFNGQTYSQRIGDLISQYGLPEKQLLTIFSELLAVMQYAQMICSNEDVTSSQISRAIASEQESIDVELVEFDPAVFAEAQAQISNEELLGHFDKYKKFFAGDVSEGNPYGFGYKLPDRVQLEYIVVRLDDISPLINPPTHQQKEDYYQKHREQLFTEQVPSDPNDPNSPLKQQTKSYAEVSDIISDQILKDKINSTANRILQEAKTLTEAGLEDTDIEHANLTDEQFKQRAGNYQTTAEQLSKKNNIKLYAGRTGLLSPIDMQTDEYLARLYLEGYGQNPVSLAQIVFAVNDLAASELGPFDVRKPRMYENIGLLKDLWGSAWSGLQDVSGQIMAVVRVIKTIKAAEPESIDQTFSTSTLEFDPNQPSALRAAEGEDAGENVYSVKEKVTEDLKKLAAIDITKSKAEEFIGLATKDGWDGAIDKFNELYGRQTSRDEGDPNVSGTPDEEESIAEPFKLQNLTGLRRISKAALQALTVQSAGKPAAPFVLNEQKNHRRFVEQLYSLVPQDSNTADAVPLVIEFKPDLSLYCIKNISVKRITLQEYEKIKAMRLQREDYSQSESLAAVYFNPENILKRMNFRLVKAGEEPADANTPARPGEARRSPTESEAVL